MLRDFIYHCVLKLLKYANYITKNQTKAIYKRYKLVNMKVK